MGITLIQCFCCYCWVKFLDSYICSIEACRLKHVRHLVFVVSNMCVIWCLSSQTCASFGVCRLKHVHHNSFGVYCLKNVHHLSFVVWNMCIICLLNHHPWLSYGHKAWRWRHVHLDFISAGCKVDRWGKFVT